MENIYILDSAVCRNWCAVGLFIKGRGRNVQRNGDPAAAVTACMAVSGGVEHSVCANGHQWRPNFPRAGFAAKEAGTESFYHTAGAELLLESDFLQSAGLRSCFLLAGGALDHGIFDDYCFQQGGSSGGMAADSLSCLADLCCIFEFWSMDAKLTQKQPAVAGCFLCSQHHQQRACADQDTADYGLGGELFVQDHCRQHQGDHHTEFINEYDLGRFPQLQRLVVA